jgi:hypothetical protein
MTKRYGRKVAVNDPACTVRLPSAIASRVALEEA